MATTDSQRNKYSRYTRDGQVKGPYDYKIEVRRLYDDYIRFSSKLQKDLPFINYVGFQLKLQNKTDMIRNKYYELARDLLAEDGYRNLQEGGINQLDSSTEKEEKSLHDNIQNNNNGTGILAGNWEIELSNEVVSTSLSDE